MLAGRGQGFRARARLEYKCMGVLTTVIITATTSSRMREHHGSNEIHSKEKDCKLLAWRAAFKIVSFVRRWIGALRLHRRPNSKTRAQRDAHSHVEG